MRSALLVAVFALLAVPARAQTNDLRWEPWLGCWNLAVDNLRPREAPEDAAGAAPRPATAIDSAPRVCVSRTSDGARFETTVGPQTAIDQTIVADAAAHPVNDGECAGTQRSEWSKSGLRLYSSAEIRCKGDAGLRNVSGLSLIAPNGNWLDIQAVTIGDRETVRVKRYSRAADSPAARPNVAGSRLTLDEVKEAGSKVSSGALEAALIETLAGFDLNSRKVMELAAAGVPEAVIDLVIALSYPDKFVIQRLAQVAPSGQTTFARDPFMLGAFSTPFFYDGYYYGSPYFYEPFGYRGYSFFGYGSTFVVEGVGGGGGRPSGSATGTGRVVNGMGYTRVTTRPSEGSSADVPASAASRSSGASAAPRDTSSSSSSGSSSSGSSSSGSSSSGSSGGGTVSSSGASSGSGSSDTGRTAVPR